MLLLLLLLLYNPLKLVFSLWSNVAEEEAALWAASRTRPCANARLVITSTESLSRSASSIQSDNFKGYLATVGGCTVDGGCKNGKGKEGRVS